MAGVIPHDQEAEELVIGGLLAQPLRVGETVDLLEPEDFYDLRHGKAFAAIRSLYSAGQAVDVPAVAYEGGVDQDLLLTLQIQAIGSPSTFHVDRVLKAAGRRRLQMIGSSLLNEATQEGADPYALAERARVELTTVESPTSGASESLSMEQILSVGETLSPWVIPGLIRSDWRAIIVAVEGSGKSTLLRQLAILSSQGLHPLAFSEMEPVRVLLVDLENPVAAIAETGEQMVRRLRLRKEGYDDSMLRVWMRPGGIDVRTRHDRLALEREVIAHRPQLVVLGPVYKLSQRQAKESYEEATDPVLRVLDDLRTRHGFALVLEHHAPQANQGARELRPFGSQRWLAWPELGFGLRKKKDSNDLRVQRFRGDRLLNQWPVELVRSGNWPWAGVYEEGTF